jgi:DNA polymerase delta subunit 1
MKRSLWGYKGDEKVPFLKITLADPKTVPKIRDMSLTSSLSWLRPDATRDRR